MSDEKINLIDNDSQNHKYEDLTCKYNAEQPMLDDIHELYACYGGDQEEYKAILSDIMNNSFVITHKPPLSDKQKLIEKFLSAKFNRSSQYEIPAQYVKLNVAICNLSVIRCISAISNKSAISYLSSCITAKIAKKESLCNKLAIMDIIDVILTEIVEDSNVQAFYGNQLFDPVTYIAMVSHVICTADDGIHFLLMSLDVYLNKALFKGAFRYIYQSAILSQICQHTDGGRFVVNSFANELLSGRTLTKIEMEIIEEYSASSFSNIGKKHLQKDAYDRIQKTFDTLGFYENKNSTVLKTITYYSMTKSIIEAVDYLKLKFPNFIEVIDFVVKHAIIYLINGKPFHFPPICLKGPSGTGKTVFCHALAEALDLPKLPIHSTQITCGSVLTGLQKTWGTASQGLVTQLIGDAEIINPMVFIDEFQGVLDKKYDNGMPVDTVLNNLLDPTEAKHHVDGCTRCPVDLSHVSWIFAANHLNGITESLKRRIRVFEIERPNSSEAPTIARNLYSDSIKEMHMDAIISAAIDDLTLQKVLLKIHANVDYRSIKSWLKDVIMEFSIENLDIVRAATAPSIKVPLKYFI